MAVRLNLASSVSVSSTSADEKDLGNLVSSISTLSMGEGGSRKLTLAGGETDLPVGLCNIDTARFLFLKVRPSSENDPAQEITIKLNDVANDAIIIKPFDDGKVAFFMVTTDSLTALFATNAGTVDVELTIVTAGD